MSEHSALVAAAREGEQAIAALRRVEALCARWDALSKRETTTTREIRAAIAGTAAG